MGRGRRGRQDDQVALRDALFRMEPELQLLEGMIAALRILGEAQDSVDHSALATLAHCGQASLTEVQAGFRDALAALRTS